MIPEDFVQGSPEEYSPLPPYQPVDHDFLSINLKVMHLVGLWNYHSQDKGSWRYYGYMAYAVFMILIMLITFVSEVLELYFNWGDFTTFAATAWFANNYGASIIKEVFILVQSDRVQSQVMKLRGGVLSSGLRWSKEQDEIAKSTNKQVRYMSIMVYSVAVTSSSGLIVLGLRTSYYPLYEAFTGSNVTGNATVMELPLKAWFPVDIQKPGNYLAIFLYQVIMVAVGPMVNIGTDTFITGLVIHACGEFRVLRKSLRILKQRALQLMHEDSTFRKATIVHRVSKLDSLKDIDEVAEYHKGSWSSRDEEFAGSEIRSVYSKAELDENVHKALVECVQHHQEILSFVSAWEDMFSTMMFTQFLSISVRICLMIFHITTSDDKGLVQVTYFQILIISFMQGFPYCFFGSELTYQSECVADDLYETPWVEGTLEFRRCLTIMMSQAHAAVRLTGGKIYVLSLETFETMVYASFSFFKLLQEFSV